MSVIPARGEDGPNISQERIATWACILLDRAAEAIRTMTPEGVPGTVEYPTPDDEAPSMVIGAIQAVAMTALQGGLDENDLSTLIVGVLATLENEEEGNGNGNPQEED